MINSIIIYRRKNKKQAASSSKVSPAIDLEDISMMKTEDDGTSRVRSDSIIPRHIRISTEFQASTTVQQKTNKQEVLKVVEGVGYGGFGVVLKVQKSSEGRGRGEKVTTLAMKVLPKKRTTGRSKNPARQVAKLLNEIRIMKAMGSSSPFVQCLHEAYETGSNVFILSEYIGGGDAFSYFSRGVKFSEKQVRIILAELFLGLEYIHSKGYLHCDIKAENVMFDGKGHVKIVDFGLARELDVELPAGQQMCLEHVGSLPYMAPELLADFAGGRHTDWWAYGVLAFEFFTGCSPWQNMNDSFCLTMEVCSRDVSLPRRSFSAAACAFIDSLLTRDYRHRLGTLQDAEIKKASFFKNVHWEKTAKLKQQTAFLPPTKGVIVSEEDRSYVMRSFEDLVASDIRVNMPVSFDNHQEFRVSRSQAIIAGEDEQELSIGLKEITVHFDSDKECFYCVSTAAAPSSVVSPMSFLDLIKPSDHLVDRPTTRLFEGLHVGGGESMDTSRSGSTTNTGSVTLDSSFVTSGSDTHNMLSLMMDKIVSDEENDM